MKSKEFTIYIQNCLFKKKWDQVLNLELKFATKKFNPQINLPFLPRQNLHVLPICWK